MKKISFLFTLLLCLNAQLVFANMQFIGSNTEENIAEAFIMESVARTKYLIFSQIAEKENNQEARDLFLLLSNQKEIESKNLFEMIKGNRVEAESELKLDKIGNTQENLKTALENDVAEYKKKYIKFEREARREGFNEIADKFKQNTANKQDHIKSYKKLIN